MALRLLRVLHMIWGHAPLGSMCHALSQVERKGGPNCLGLPACIFATKPVTVSLCASCDEAGG